MMPDVPQPRKSLPPLRFGPRDQGNSPSRPGVFDRKSFEESQVGREKLPGLLRMSLAHRRQSLVEMVDKSTQHTSTQSSPDLRRTSEINAALILPELPEHLRLPLLREPTAANLTEAKRSPFQRRKFVQYKQRQNAYDYMLRGWLHWSPGVRKTRDFYLNKLNPNRKKEDIEEFSFDNKGFISQDNKITRVSDMKSEALKGSMGTDADDDVAKPWQLRTRQMSVSSVSSEESNRA